MRFLGNVKEKRKCLFYAGSPVLLLTVQTPVGDTPAALHLTRLVELLTDYTKKQLFPLAARSFSKLAQEGLGYRFDPYRVCIFVTESDQEAPCVTVTFSVRSGEEPPLERKLVTHWDPSGTLQFPKKRHSAHRHPPQKSAATDNFFHATKFLLKM